jgi:hypothetical protein
MMSMRFFARRARDFDEPGFGFAGADAVTERS